MGGISIENKIAVVYFNQDINTNTVDFKTDVWDIGNQNFLFSIPGGGGWSFDGSLMATIYESSDQYTNQSIIISFWDGNNV